jgi:hypothetical protein
MIAAALLASLAIAPASAASADVLVYYNQDIVGSTTAFSGMSNAITGAGGTISWTSVRGTTAWPTSYSSSVKLIIFVLPPDSFNSAEAAAVANVVRYGGRVVVMGDWDDGSAVTFSAENGFANSLLSAMGMSMRIQGSLLLAGTTCSSAATIQSDSLTSGVSTLYVASSSYVTGGTSLLSFAGVDLVQVEELPGAAGSRDPYDVIVSGDTNIFLDTCTGASSTGANYTFWENLYTGLCPDDDGDGYTDDTCGGSDCDDADSSSYPSASETCDGADNDCDGATDEGVTTVYYEDADNDSYGDASSATKECSLPSGFSVNNTDCDDTDSSVYPGATETCDGDDEDCDYTIDEGAESTFYRDSDGDGYGNSASTTEACDVPSGYSSDATDCDDGDATRYPGAPEICDGDDEDCDGSIDEGKTGVYYWDGDHDGWGDSSITSETCSAGSGYVSDGGDCDDSDSSVHPTATEVAYDGIDQDCDGDDLCDVDGDGVDYTSCPSGTDCDDDDSSTYPGATDRPYDGIDQDCDGVDIIDVDGDGYDADHAGGSDCNDTDSTVLPGASESCDGEDQDCDGIVDEGTVCLDDDGDGFTETGGDCDDTDDTVSPAGFETCDGDDEDCDSIIDEGTDCYDDDGDGYTEDDGDCNDADAAIGPHAKEIDENGIDDDCDSQVDAGVSDPDGDGYTIDGGDCAEEDGDVYPGATELADNEDNDCDGEVDEGTVGYDDDGDGYTELDDDCHDGDDEIYPGANEIVDGIDNDCDGAVDEGGPQSDDDGDGFTEEGGDCDDSDAEVHPGAAEIPNGVDDDCDGVEDDGTTAYDDDSDGYSEDEGDCDDGDGWRHPGAEETCEGIDNDCDSLVDEGCDDLTTPVFTEVGICSGCGTGVGISWIWLLGLGAFGRRRRESVSPGHLDRSAD